MSEIELMDIVENAKMIVNGYAFSLDEDGFVRVLNLEHPDCAMVVNLEGELIDSNMDEIEQKIVMELCDKNLKFIGEQYA